MGPAIVRKTQMQDLKQCEIKVCHGNQLGALATNKMKAKV